MHCLWVALIFSPWTLFNVDGAAVTNFYNSFTNKKFGGESSCVTETDVSASFGVEGENVRQKTEKNIFQVFPPPASTCATVTVIVGGSGWRAPTPTPSSPARLSRKLAT